MRKLKYIRFETGFVVFAEPMMHKQIRTESNINYISAGFCYWQVNIETLGINWTCYGESISLNLKSLPEDSELLTRQMNGEW